MDKKAPKKSRSLLAKIIRVTLLTLATLILLVLVAAIAIPYFFKEELIELTRREANKHIRNAEVDFDDVDISIFRNFPKLTLGIKDLEVIGKDAFEGVNLADIGRLDLSMDIMSVVRPEEGQPIAIHSVALQDPDIHVVVLRNGMANYDLAPASEGENESSSSGGFQLELSKYNIQNGNIIYDDRQGGTYLQIKGMDHSGKGNFTESIYDIATDTKIKGVTVRSGGMTYLNDARLDADIVLNANMNEQKYTLRDNKIDLNTLRLHADGWVQTQGDAINLDFNFNAPSTAFRDILSMIPGAYTESFKDVETNGQFKLDGGAKGTYDANRMPAFHLDLEVADAAFQYPDLPMGMEDINTEIHVKSPSSDLDRMTVDIPKFHTRLGQNAFDVSLQLRTPISDPDVDAVVDGVIDLADIAKALPMEGVESMKGRVTADIAVKTKMSYIDQAAYDKVDMKGSMKLENIDYASEGMPHVVVNAAQMDFTPQNVRLNQFNAKMGKSDIQASGTLDNILTYFMPGQPVKGKLKLKSQLFDANEWIAEEAAEKAPQPAPAPPAPRGEAGEEVFDQFQFELDARMDRILYEDYELRHTVAKGRFTPSEIDVSQLDTKVGGSDIEIDGKLVNIFGYLFDNEVLGGSINLTSNKLDLNELMGIGMEEAPGNDRASEPASGETTELVLVPDNMAVNINADVKEVIYTNMDLKDIKGRLDIKDEKLSLTDVYAKLLGGSMKLTGGYDTKDKANPMFEFGYDIDKFDFQKSFNTFNTFQAIAPIGEYVKGIFDSHLTMQARMGQDMMPDLNTLSAEGELLTLNAIIENFIPMKRVADKLNIKHLAKDIPLKNTFNKFNVKDGRVTMQEFPFQYEDVKMRIGGSHGFDNTMDYAMKLHVPVGRIGKGQVAGLANSGLDYLNGIASQAGINLKQLKMGEMVEIDLKLTGDFKKPDIKVVRVVMSGEEGGGSVKDAILDEVKDIVDDKIQEGKDFVEDKVEEAKDKATEQVNQAVDKVTEQVEDKVTETVDQVKDEIEDKVTEEVNDAVKGKIDEATNQVGDQVKDKVDDAIKDQVGDKADEVEDKIKDGLDKWNPWKKKKKKDPK